MPMERWIFSIGNAVFQGRPAHHGKEVYSNYVSETMRWRCLVFHVLVVGMVFKDDYPSTPPKCKFEPPLFHPNIYPVSLWWTTVFVEFLSGWIRVEQYVCRCSTKKKTGVQRSPSNRFFSVFKNCSTSPMRKIPHKLKPMPFTCKIKLNTTNVSPSNASRLVNERLCFRHSRTSGTISCNGYLMDSIWCVQTDKVFECCCSSSLSRCWNSATRNDSSFPLSVFQCTLSKKDQTSPL